MTHGWNVNMEENSLRYLRGQLGVLEQGETGEQASKLAHFGRETLLNVNKKHRLLQTQSNGSINFSAQEILE